MSHSLPKALIFLAEYEKEDIAKIFKDKIDKILSGKKYAIRGFDDIYKRFDENIEKLKKSLFLPDFSIGGYLVINYFSKIKKMLEHGPVDIETFGTQEDQLVNFVDIIPKVLFIYAFYKKFPKYIRVFEKESRFKNFDEVKKVLTSFDSLSFHELYQFIYNEEFTLFLDTAKKGILEYTVKRYLKPIYEYKDVQIYEVKTYKECRALGAGTNWCTSSSSGGYHIEKYLGLGRLFIIVDGNEKYHLFLSDQILKSKEVRSEYDIFYILFSFCINKLKESGDVVYSKTHIDILNCFEVLTNQFKPSIQIDVNHFIERFKQLFSIFERNQERAISFFEGNEREAFLYMKNVFIPIRERDEIPIYNIFIYPNLLNSSIFGASSGKIGLYSGIIFLSLFYNFFEEEIFNYPNWPMIINTFHTSLQEFLRQSVGNFIFEFKDSKNNFIPFPKLVYYFKLMGEAIPECAPTLHSISKLYSDYKGKGDDYISAMADSFKLSVSAIEKIIYPIFLNDNLFKKFNKFLDPKNEMVKVALKTVLNRNFSINDYYDLLEENSGARIENLLSETASNISSSESLLVGECIEIFKKMQKKFKYDYGTYIHLIDRLIQKIEENLRRKSEKHSDS